jgi:hypothetical protein
MVEFLPVVVQVVELLTQVSAGRDQEPAGLLVLMAVQMEPPGIFLVQVD